MKKLIITTGLTAALAAGTIAGTHVSSASAATMTDAQHSTVHHLPHWFHWKYASNAATREVCGKHQQRAIIIWAGKGDGALVCSNGSINGS
jgi:hypothetical protein